MEPQTVKDKVKNDPYIADNNCFIGYAAVTYNACWKIAE